MAKMMSRNNGRPDARDMLSEELRTHHARCLEHELGMRRARNPNRNHQALVKPPQHIQMTTPDEWQNLENKRVFAWRWQARDYWRMLERT